MAFSCKRRGFCPSCGARRMAETAAHLVDYVIPRVPVRQWVLAFPIPLRLLFAAHPHLLSSVLQIVHRVLSTFLIQQTGLQRTEAKTGAVTLIQRFGSAANLYLHVHVFHCISELNPLEWPYRMPAGAAPDAPRGRDALPPTRSPSVRGASSKDRNFNASCQQAMYRHVRAN